MITIRYTSLALLAAVSLVACNHLPSSTEKVEDAPIATMEKSEDSMKKDDAMMEDSNSDIPDAMEKKDEPSMETSVSYVAYEDGVIGNGEESILFFHASWCPSCKSADIFLQQEYLGSNPTLTTYKIDYDTETELKKRYGIVMQHTFVKIDADGNALETLPGPTNSRLGQLISS